MENRRVNQRFIMHQMIEIGYSKEETFINVATIDISISGLKCKFKSPIKSSSEIFLMFEVPNKDGNHVIKCYGEISWQNKEGDFYFAGITFKHLYDSDKIVLQEYLDTLEE